MGLAVAAIHCILGLLLLIQTDQTIAQSRRPSPRSLSTSIRSSSTTSEFDCPEEFGYYPHPSDCSQYYVCVFGGALLESCTGGLMYSHELQTCDWPRNVGCQLADNVEQSASSREVTPRIPQVQQIQPQKFRFSSVPSNPSDQPSKSSYSIPAQIQTIPPPPELRIAPKPVVTSRGQPKLSFQEDIAKLYAETHDTLPPVEEEESDRQQRVYRGQPSTVSQVQRDRDGILQQSSVNAIPNHGKFGSFAFGSQVNQHRVESSSQTAPSPPVFVQQQQQQPQPKPIQQQNNRNYYNTTSNQGYNNPSQYDTYYSVYDDDIDLYRDVDYVQQFNPNTDKSRQSTHRTTTSTVSTTTSTPSRDVYTPKQTPAYEKPSQSYNAEYDDALISQLDVGNAYNTPSRTQLRGDRNELNLISDRPYTSRTPLDYTLSTYTPTRSTYVLSTAPAKITTNTPSTTTTTSTTVSRTNNRNRGGSHYTANNDDRSTVAVNRGTHPPRSRPTLKPSGNIVSKATEFVDIYRFPPTRPESLYPQPIPDKTAARCRKDVCLLPDCSCGGKEIPGNFEPHEIPQIVLLTFDDAVNDINREIYAELFTGNRTNPNGCPITATFYVSHEWTDYGQVQNLYADGHEMASHTVSHSFGEQFSQKKWTREVAGQREILAAYGGVKLSDVKGMRAPFLSVGGNKMFKMLYDSNFTYDSSMPVYENRPPSWPYTLDYKIFHDCMIPPCPTKSYPGVWQVPMVMWQDLNGGRCSMGDACANPPDADGVVKMLMKNFERHYTTNRAPFGLFYHAAWFTQPHHKDGFIKFLDMINAMNDVWIVTNWQMLQWVRDPTPSSRMNSFQPFQCDYSDRPKRCNNPKVCNLWHKSGVRYMRTCQPCPEIYPWTGKTGIRSSRVDIDTDE